MLECPAVHFQTLCVALFTRQDLALCEIGPDTQWPGSLFLCQHLQLPQALINPAETRKQAGDAHLGIEHVITRVDFQVMTDRNLVLFLVLRNASEVVIGDILLLTDIDQVLQVN